MNYFAFSISGLLGGIHLSALLTKKYILIYILYIYTQKIYILYTSKISDHQISIIIIIKENNIKWQFQ